MEKPLSISMWHVDCVVRSVFERIVLHLISIVGEESLEKCL